MQGMSGPLESATTRLAGAITLPVAEVLEPAVGCNCANACSAVIPANIRRWEDSLFIKKKYSELVGKVQAYSIEGIEVTSIFQASGFAVDWLVGSLLVAQTNKSMVWKSEPFHGFRARNGFESASECQ